MRSLTIAATTPHCCVRSPVSEDFSIHAVFPNYYDGTRVSYSFKSLLETMGGPRIPVHGYVFGKAFAAEDDVCALLPLALYKHTSRLVRRPCQAIVGRYGYRMRRGDVAYLWLDSPPQVTRKLQDRGVVVVREMINCTADRCRAELTEAHRRLGIAYCAPWTDQVVEDERQQLLAADAVLCPNDMVFESVVACGVPANRCIKTSYGWSATRLEGTSASIPKDGRLTFLFVGTGDVRKGLPWLLQAWDRAGVAGKLLLAGTIDSRVKIDYARVLSRSDVIQLGHVSNVGAAYRSADVFCFTSWEEGGPMVTIEAMGMGLPCIVSPMGGAGILSKRSGGAIMVDPGDVDSIVHALRQVADSPSLRSQLGGECRAIARDYVWERVGARRTEAIRKVREARFATSVGPV